MSKIIRFHLFFFPTNHFFFTPLNFSIALRDFLREPEILPQLMLMKYFYNYESYEGDFKFLFLEPRKK
ncbi:MAG: hypothetical protein CM15mP69_6110 [Ectothiorhodospiraceae bacterium]|nr:MAG: hypothetical protein CM15mP69_6110 [Ectothiorhodospiraceae bacterium]